MCALFGVANEAFDWSRPLRGACPTDVAGFDYRLGKSLS